MESLFFIVLKEWGPVAVSILLIFVVAFLIREVKKYSAAEKLHIAELHNDISNMRADVNKTLNGFGERLSYIEQNYVKNEFFFRELSGWRSEINRLGDKTDGNFAVLIQNIMQFLNQGKK